mgnify:CR=1 FL=1
MSKELKAWEEIGKLKVEGYRVIPKAATVSEYQNYSIVGDALKDYENTKRRLDDTQALLLENFERLKATIKQLDAVKEIAKLYDIEFCDKNQTISFKVMLRNKFILETITINDKEKYDLLKEVLLWD